MSSLQGLVAARLRVSTAWRCESFIVHSSNTCTDSLLFPHSTLGGNFKLELFLPEEYPMAPPKVRFLTKIYHPNIGEQAARACVRVWTWTPHCSLHALHFAHSAAQTSSEGSVSTFSRVSDEMAHLIVYPRNRRLTRLSTSTRADKWSPALQIRTVLLSIQALLSAPNPDDPLDNGVAEHWKRDEKG